MATQSSFKQQCPSCEAMVPIRDPKLIGRKIDCPKCKYRFVVEEPADEVDEVEEEEAPAKKGKSGITNKKPASGKAGKPALKRRADDDEDEEAKPKKKKDGGSGMLILGIGLGAVAIIALAVGAVFLLSDDKEEKKPSGRPAANVAPPSGGDDVQKPADLPKEDTAKDKPKPKQDDITNLLPNDTQAVLNLPLEYLFGNGKVNEAFLRTPGAFHENAFRRIWGITPSDIRRVVMAYNIEKKTIFSVMRTSMPLNEKQIIGGLKLKPEAAVGDLKYYLLQKPLDALSTFLLKGGEPHDKAALHFIDPFTVVCADKEPMNQFLQAKRQPKRLSKQAAAEPAEGGAKEGAEGAPPGGPGGPPGGRPGGPGAMPGMPGGRPGGRPGGPPRGMGGPPDAGQEPSSDGGNPDAAPVSSSYLTVDPHLKAVLDQVEKVDKKENQHVLLSLAMSTSAASVENVKKSMTQQGVETSMIPDAGLKVVLELVQSKLKAVGVAVTEFGQSKVVVNAGAEFADDKLAREWKQKADEAIPVFLASQGLDLVAKNASGANGNMLGMPGGMQGGMPGRMAPGMGPAGGFNGRQPPGGGFNGMPTRPGGGFPGAQPSEEGDKNEEKGKLGDYLTWTKDNVVALGANVKITSDHYKKADKPLQYVAILIRSVSAMSDRPSRIHELAAAMQAYLDKTGHFPRGALPRKDDVQHVLGWRPDQRLSWMIQLLPYLANGEFGNLKFDADKDWHEDFDNQKTGLTVIPQFVAPSSSDNPMYFYVQYPNLHVVEGPGLWAATHFVGMAGIGLDAAEYRADDAAKAKLRGVFGYDRETKKDDIKDGLEQTIVLIQVPPEPKAPWIAGGGSTVRGVSEDLECVQPFISTEYQGKRGTFAIMADGKVRFIPANIDPKTFQALCTIAGGDKIKDLDKIAPEVPPPEDLLDQAELKAEPAAPQLQPQRPANVKPEKSPAAPQPQPPADAKPGKGADKSKQPN